MGKVLTHSAIQGAKPKDKPFKLSDTGRLYVLVAVAGSKYWKWNYRIDGKDCTYKLGTFPKVGLAEARQRRDAAAKLVEKGIHPAEHDREQKPKASAEKATTFWSVAQDWIDANKGNWTPGYFKQVETCMHRYVRDTDFGQRPIRAITTADIYRLVTGVAKRTELREGERKSGSATIAILLRNWCHAVFRLAVASSRADRNPVADLKASDAIVRPKVKNNRALSQIELQNLLRSLSAFTGQRTTAIAIELLALTFVRTQELRAAMWSEFDLDAGVWTIPAARMKIKHSGDHVVPLSTQARALLKELRGIVGTPLHGPDWLFPNTRDREDCMTATTINRALERMGFSGKDSIGFSAHGFRGTASTLLHEKGYRPEVIEVQLAHKERNAVKAAYNKAKYMAERQTMMQDWADFLDQLKHAPATALAVSNS